MRQPTLLLVDLSYQTYRAAAAHPLLRSQDRVFTGGLFGFMVTVMKIVRDCAADRVVVCEDVKPYKRSLVYPEYKQLRKSTEDSELREKYLSSVPLVKEFLGVAGIPIMRAPGFESDDCIGHTVRKYHYRFHSIIAASNDSDLYQLLAYPRFRVWRKDHDSVMDAARLLKETGLSPPQFMTAASLMGTHNDVAGIPRVGEKTAYKAVQNPGALRQYMEQHRALIERNQHLQHLPYDGFPFDLELPPPGTFDRHALYRWSARYDINITSAMVTALEQVTA